MPSRISFSPSHHRLHTAVYHARELLMHLEEPIMVVSELADGEFQVTKQLTRTLERVNAAKVVPGEPREAQEKRPNACE